MSLRDIFNRNKAKQLDAEPEEGDDTGMMAGNDAVRKKQTMWLAIIAGFIVLLGGWYILKPSGKAAIASTDGKDVTIATDDMVNRNMSQREWQASSEAQMQSIAGRSADHREGVTAFVVA